MITFDSTIVAAIASAGMGLVAWAFRLESRVNTHIEANAVFQESIKESLKTEFSALDNRLARIEDAIIRRAYERDDRDDRPARRPNGTGAGPS